MRFSLATSSPIQHDANTFRVNSNIKMPGMTNFDYFTLAHWGGALFCIHIPNQIEAGSRPTTLNLFVAFLPRTELSNEFDTVGHHHN